MKYVDLYKNDFEKESDWVSICQCVGIDYRRAKSILLKVSGAEITEEYIDENRWL